MHIVPRLPRKSSGAQGTPEGRQGVHPIPWQCTLPHACHAKAAEPKGHRRDASAYIRPLGSAHCPTPATQKQRSPRDTGGTPGRRSEQCTLSHACHAKAAEPNRAYIRPLSRAHCPTPATQKQRSPRDTGGTPGRTFDPLAVHIVPRLPRKSSGAQGTPEGRQGVHPTPWQRTLSHACHAKEGHGGTPGRTSDPLAVHKGSDVRHAHCPTPVHPIPWQCTLPQPKGHRRDARAYIRPLGSTHCPTPATQKRE